MILEDLGTPADEFTVTGKFITLPYEQLVKRLTENSPLVPNVEKAMNYLEARSDPSAIAFFCVGGFERSQALVEEFMTRQTQGKLLNYQLLGLGHYPAEEIISVIEKMVEQYPDLPRTVVIAYEQRHGEPATVMRALLIAKLHQHELIKNLKVNEAITGDLSSINIQLLMVEIPD